jgi:hypothetical protein
MFLCGDNSRGVSFRSFLFGDKYRGVSFRCFCYLTDEVDLLYALCARP